MTAKHILGLLAVRHKDDVFVPECKDGPTQATNHVRMDAWAMARSWAHPNAIGYEIKVSRSDFLGDNKWPAYLPLCNQFYFVAPRGVISAKELSADVGLLEVASTGTMLRTIKKAPQRDVQIPDELYRYILMCRAVVKSEFEQEDAVAYWKRYVQESEESKGIGLAASKKIAQAYRAMEQQVTEAQNIVAKYDKHREALAAIGINPDDRWDSAFRQKLQELDGPLTKWHIERLKDIQKYASQILETLVPKEPL